MTLIDATDSTMCVKVMSQASKLRAKIGGKDLLVAIVGVTSELQKVTVNAFSNNFYLAGSMEKAKDWLIGKAQEREKENEN